MSVASFNTIRLILFKHVRLSGLLLLNRPAFTQSSFQGSHLAVEAARISEMPARASAKRPAQGTLLLISTHIGLRAEEKLSVALVFSLEVLRASFRKENSSCSSGSRGLTSAFKSFGAMCRDVQGEGRAIYD